MERKLVFNHRYFLRNENDKIVILMKPDSVNTSSICVLHPIYAMILCFVDGCTIDEASKRASIYLDIDKDKIKDILKPLMFNKIKIEGYESVFPEFTLVEFQESTGKRGLNPNDFYCDNLNLKLSRLKAPADIICNITMKCYVDCFYCYANRSKNTEHKMSVDKICTLIEEAYNLGVVSFKLMGGDIFLYKEWEIILRKLKQFDYSPCISTKLPLLEKDVLKLKELLDNKIPLQISLDSLLPKNIEKILRINGEKYMENMKSFIILLEKHKIAYTIHTVLNSENDISDIKSIQKFINKKEFIKEWYVDSAKCSMYLPYGFDHYKPKKENILLVAEYLYMLSETTNNFRIHAPSYSKNINNISKERKSKIFNNRVSCSGNVSSMYILPDGKVTLCEELYWHPHFIMGDLNQNSIEEVWNSSKANSLFYIMQSEFAKESPCSTCKEFLECRSYKHVCWRDVILAYGQDKWYYPDPFCPRAPLIKKDMFID